MMNIPSLDHLAGCNSDQSDSWQHIRSESAHEAQPVAQISKSTVSPTSSRQPAYSGTTEPYGSGASYAPCGDGQNSKLKTQNWQTGDSVHGNPPSAAAHALGPRTAHAPCPRPRSRMVPPLPEGEDRGEGDEISRDPRTFESLPVYGKNPCRLPSSIAR